MTNLEMPQIQILFPMDKKIKLENYDICFPSLEILEKNKDIKSKSKTLISDQYKNDLNPTYNLLDYIILPFSEQFSEHIKEKENAYYQQLYYQNHYDSIPNNIIILKYIDSFQNRKLNKIILDKINTISNHNILQNKENIIIKYHLLKRHYLIIDIKMEKQIEELFKYGFEYKDIINYKLLKFNNFNYIPCSFNRCPFPALIERKNNLIIVTCIQKHYCVYNSLLDLLLNLHYQHRNDICSLCDKPFDDLNDKWYCPKCEKYFHNKDEIIHYHGLIEYKKLINYCNFHLDELKKYCEDCKRGICDDCEKNCKEKKHKINNFDNFDEEKIDEEIINFFINDCKYESFEYEKYICLQYINMKKKEIPILPNNYEIFHNFNNYLKKTYPKIIGDFYFGELYKDQKDKFQNYLNDKSFVFFKILDNNNFIGYKFNKEFIWFTFDKSSKNYNKKEINIDKEIKSIQNLFYDGENLFIIYENKYIMINENSVGNVEECEGKIIQITDSYIVEKITNKEIKITYDSNFLTIRNKPDIKVLYLKKKDDDDDMKILFCEKKGKNKYEFCLKNEYLSNIYASNELNLGIYKLFYYEKKDDLLIVLHDFNILKAKINKLNFEELITKDKILKENPNCDDCFISDDQLVFFSKEKVYYYPLSNNLQIN